MQSGGQESGSRHTAGEREGPVAPEMRIGRQWEIVVHVVTPGHYVRNLRLMVAANPPWVDHEHQDHGRDRRYEDQHDQHDEPSLHPSSIGQTVFVDKGKMLSLVAFARSSTTIADVFAESNVARCTVFVRLTS
jgi:hypothetical protein